MLFSIRKQVRFVVCALACFGLQHTAYASEKLSEYAEFRLLADLVAQVLEQNPELQAAYAATSASKARLAAAGLPLNNPELALEAERTDINTYSLGISQTFDWHDKQAMYEKTARAEQAASQAEVSALQLSTSTALLEVISKALSARKVAFLSQRRTGILERFSDLARQRHAAGDISLAALELARLSLTEAVMLQAEDQAELIQANSTFAQISSRQLPEVLSLPEPLPKQLPGLQDKEKILQQHPQLRMAHLKAQAMRQKALSVKKAQRADPTLGLAAGREDNDKLISVSFSIPLQVRNDFRYEGDAAEAETQMAEKQALQTYQALLARLNSAYDRYNLVATTWSVWSSTGLPSLNQRITLLEKQWQSGEMNTTDYLLQVQQTLDTQIAGVRLQGKLWLAWIEWLNLSGSLNQWLDSIPGGRHDA